MNIVLINENLAFAPQLQPEYVAEIATYGFEQLICNRPDDEEMGQPSFTSIEAEAKKHGMSVIYAPVANSQFTEEVIEATQNALASDKKTVMFCRSGTRSSILWSIIQTRQGKPITETLDSLVEIGYNIRHIQDFIIKMAQKN